MSEESVINHKALEEIKSLQSRNGSDLLTKIINIYLDKSESLCDEIGMGATEKNEEQLWVNAHSLKSSSASVGAMRVFEICSALENKGRAGDLNDVEPLVTLLQEELALAAAELHMILQQDS